MTGHGRHKAVRVTLIVIEILAVLAFLGSLPVFNAGNIVGLLITVPLLLITVFWYRTAEFRRSGIGRVVMVSLKIF